MFEYLAHIHKLGIHPSSEVSNNFCTLASSMGESCPVSAILESCRHGRCLLRTHGWGPWSDRASAFGKLVTISLKCNEILIHTMWGWHYTELSPRSCPYSIRPRVRSWVPLFLVVTPYAGAKSCPRETLLATYDDAGGSGAVAGTPHPLILTHYI